MIPLVLETDGLLQSGPFDYGFCGGYAIELFVEHGVRNHEDIDVAVFWDQRNEVIQYMQSQGWLVYEVCDGGLIHHITDLDYQFYVRRNLFCTTPESQRLVLHSTNEPDIFFVDFPSTPQKQLDFVEFLFNHRSSTHFLYARNQSIQRELYKSFLYAGHIPYLAPELVLLYKSTSIDRPGYQADYEHAFPYMSLEQKEWLNDALRQMNPTGHPWIL